MHNNIRFDLRSETTKRELCKVPAKSKHKTELLKHPYTTTATPSYSRYIYQLLIKNRERPFTLQTIAFIFSLPLQLQHLLVAINNRSNTKQNCGLPASSACYTSLLPQALPHTVEYRTICEPSRATLCAQAPPAPAKKGECIRNKHRKGCTRCERNSETRSILVRHNKHRKRFDKTLRRGVIRLSVLTVF